MQAAAIGTEWAEKNAIDDLLAGRPFFFSESDGRTQFAHRSQRFLDRDHASIDIGQLFSGRKDGRVLAGLPPSSQQLDKSVQHIEPPRVIGDRLGMSHKQFDCGRDIACGGFSHRCEVDDVQSMSQFAHRIDIRARLQVGDLLSCEVTHERIERFEARFHGGDLHVGRLGSLSRIAERFKVRLPRQVFRVSLLFTSHMSDLLQRRTRMILQLLAKCLAVLPPVFLGVLAHELLLRGDLRQSTQQLGRDATVAEPIKEPRLARCFHFLREQVRFRLVITIPVGSG